MAPYDPSTGPGPGMAWVYSGKDGSELYVYRGSGTTLAEALKIAGLGDVNNDGRADYVIGFRGRSWLSLSP